jgi:hypothetical protein
MFLDACAYYLRCSTRNRIVALGRRLRSPKYAIGAALILLYFWGVFFANPAFGETSDPEGHRRNAVWIIAAMILVQLIVVWFASGRGIGFREADVQILFPRPFSRFQLLAFKWIGTVFATLIGSLVLGLFLVRYDGLSYPNVALGLWLLQTTLATHGILFGLVQSRMKARGGLPARLRFAPAWALLAAVPTCAGLAWQASGGVRSWADANVFVQTAPLSYLLAPLEWIAAPIATQTPGAFLVAALFPLAVFLAHALVLWRVDLSFEDQALELAEKIQNIRSQGLGAFRSKKALVAKPGSPWSLAPTGPAWKALVWKNVVSVTRFPRATLIRVALIVIVMAALFGSVMSKSEGGDLPTRAGFVILFLLGYLSLLGPALVRVDLRIDIPHFDVLKSMPLRGRTLIFGEIMGPVVVLFAIQAVGCVAAAILITEESGQVFGWADKLPALVAALVGFFALDFMLLTAENLMALWLPGFVRLGPGLKPGLDQMGQNLLGALIRMFALLIFLIFPVGVGIGVGVGATAASVSPFLAVASGVVVGSAMLLAQSVAMIRLSEGRYERFDITSERTTSDA